MSVFSFFQDSIHKIVNQLAEQEGWALPSDLKKFMVEPTRDPVHGDIATNVGMVLAKPLGINPRELAQKIAQKLGALDCVEKTDVAGPGFINLKLTDSFWHDQLWELLDQGLNYGDSTIGQGQKLNVEFVSVNPTGPLHTGHGRNAVLGDAIASLLQKVGYDVFREYYVNDAGGQINALARSVHLRYQEALGHEISPSSFTEGMYGGDYLVPLGKALAEKYGSQWLDCPESEWLEIFRIYSVDAMMKDIRSDLASLGVCMDIYTSERELVKAGLIEETLKILEEQGDVYKGVLTPPKGFVVDDWEERPQTLFRATTYGDDIDRPLCKSDGSWTYFAGDIAYHVDKVRRGFYHMVNVMGADHSGYVKRQLAAVKAATQGAGNLEIKICQMVNFLDNGVPVRMSKRAGVFITISDVIDRVGKDATRFMMISRHQDMPVDFDFVKVLEESKDNPIFYIQYAHARICSVLRHSKTVFPDLDLTDINAAPLKILTDDSELSMIRILADWPRQVELAAQVREPHRVATFLHDVASQFHSLWNKGKDNTHLRFIDPSDQEATKARLALITGVKSVIAGGLTLLGIKPVEEMR
ncbi:MAG: arginine--tRNA ligase [Alphaproteobacteria bacterium]|nr:arginine--tRNA ligase [Alphaproteobacteria bacterium]